jgi:hypothetical protein
MTRVIVFAVLAVALSLTAQAQSISAARAHDLATTYMAQHISLCGIVEQAVSRSTYWDLPIRIGQAYQSAGSIRVDKRTGVVSYPHHPDATPQSLAAWEKSLEKRHK